MARPSKAKTAAAAAGSNSNTPANRGRTIAAAKKTVASSSTDVPARAPSPPIQPFRFFDLPSEVRVQIYEEILLLKDPLDLDQSNYRLVRPRLNLLAVSQRMHHEAHGIFYSQTVRLFPHHNHGRFFYTKKPLLTRLPPHYRAAVRAVELRLGSGWHKPPACQNTNPSLGLHDCVRLRTLRIFVECDPSDDVFNGFRGRGSTAETYNIFCVNLLTGIFEQVPSLETVEIDAYVKKDAPLLKALQWRVEQGGKTLVWGPLLKAWEKDGNEPALIGLEQAMAGLGLDGPSETPRIVQVQA